MAKYSKGKAGDYSCFHPRMSKSDIGKLVRPKGAPGPESKGEIKRPKGAPGPETKK